MRGEDVVYWYHGKVDTFMSEKLAPEIDHGTLVAPQSVRSAMQQKDVQ